LVVVAYGNSLQNGFVLDDRILIVENQLLANLDTLPVLLLDDYWLVRLNPHGDPPFFSGLYRPLTVGSYALNYAAGGVHPFGYHLMNLLLHLIVTWVLYLLARQFAFPRESALVAAALFAVHPLHTEAVSNVVGRAELLMALGVLSSLWFAGQGKRTLSIVAFAVGLLSKEQAAVLPLLLVLVEACEQKGPFASSKYQIAPSHYQPILARLVKRYGPYILVLTLMLILRTYALGGRFVAHIGFLENPAAYTDSWTRFLTAVKVAGTYLWLSVWPAALSADYSYDAIPLARSVLDGPVLASLVAWGSLAALAVWSFIRGDRRVTVSLGLTIITFAPASNLLVPIGTLMGERLFYLPLAGLCLLAGLAYERIMRSVAGSASHSGRILVLRFALVAVCLAMTVRTMARNRDWVSSETLFRSAAQVVPNSAKAHAALAVELGKKPSVEDREQAVEDYQTAVRIYPEYLYKDPTLAENLVRLRRELNAERGPMSNERRTWE
jgi:hypothetical protein